MLKMLEIGKRLRFSLFQHLCFFQLICNPIFKHDVKLG